MYDLDTIDAYILGNLSPQDKNSFEETLAKDENLRAQVKERKELVLVAQLASAATRKKELKALYGELEAEEKVDTPKNDRPSDKSESPTQETTTRQKGKLIRFLPYLLAAACLAAFCFLFLFNTTPELHPLLNAHYSPYSVTVRSGDNATEKEKAYQLYSDKNYEAAVPLLRQLAKSNEEARLLLGISLLETGSTEEALVAFRGLSNSMLFADHANWYAALTHIQLNQEPIAKVLLQALTNQTEYAEKAKQLLEKL